MANPIFFPSCLILWEYENDDESIFIALCDSCYKSEMYIWSIISSSKITQEEEEEMGSRKFLDWFSSSSFTCGVGAPCSEL